ncbi:AtpZ/AtpI family protein [Algibacter sp. L4_22]|uniref:AtpZ/AtpI family protein n=1 Tax=Algibacter sp. L4_22 TaxID=2942477 RepID=UPI00201B8A35|nr:AtpZ/AtpI family protein [Algibacter sp. L4_22]MCL5127294.1 AtpZ/AtpI family protein [Algibacter sp. L4_22]
MADNKKQPKKQLKQITELSGIAVQMGITIYLFVVFGKWLDSKFTNNYSLYTVIFSLLGVLLAMYKIIKQVASMNNEK